MRRLIDKHIGGATVLCCLTLLVCTANQSYAQPDKPLEKVTLQLSWYNQFQFAGYYAAQLKGYYQEEGLGVEIRERIPDVMPVDAVLEGEADFGIANSDIVLLRMQGKPVVVLAVIVQHSPWCLLTRADSGILVPEDFVGKTVAMEITYRDAEIQAMFAYENISVENINVVKDIAGVDPLVSGAIDAQLAYLSNQPYTLKSRGIQPRVIRPLTYGVDFYGDNLFTSKRQIKEHPERVAAFRRASLKGWQYAMDNPEEIVDHIISAYYNDTANSKMHKSRENLLIEATVMEDELMHSKLIAVGQMNPLRWRRIAETYVSLGMAESADSLEGFIYDPDPHPDYPWIKWTAGIVAATAAILFLFSLRLRRAVRLRTLDLSAANISLRAANQQLSASEQQLGAANQQLQAGEQQLRAANQQLRAGEQQLRAANKALQRSQAILNQTGRSARIGGWEMDVETNEITWTDEVARIYGLPEDQFPSLEEAMDFIQQPDRDALYKALQVTAEEGKPYELEMRFVSAKGERLWVCGQGGVHQEDGKIVKLYGTFQDITKRKLAELDREHLLRTLQAKNRELQSIVYTASHDLKSPLVNIKGFSGELENHCRALRGLLDSAAVVSEGEKEIQSLIEEAIPECLEFINAGADKMNLLLDGLLRVSRVGSAELNIEALDMNKMIASVVSTMQYQISDRDTEIVTEPLPNCAGDYVLTNQVFSNLIDNALKYLDPDRKGRVTVTGRVEKDTSIYCVEDNGIGIRPEHQDKVFEIFHRLEPNDAAGGEGLGLTIVTRILDRLDGTITAEGEPGKGSRFIVSLPTA
jgi:PAS domain S-box-containing protein